MARIFDTIVSAATLATCVAIAVMLYRVPRPPAPPEPYAIGDRVSVFDEQLGADAAGTLLLVVRDGCGFCAESMDFYREMLQRRRAVAKPLRVVAVALAEASADKARQYVRTANALDVDDVVILSPQQHKAFRVVGTPTLLVVDREGIVREQWIGKLDKEQERTVIARVLSGSVQPLGARPADKSN